jgi:hypothetical protein
LITEIPRPDLLTVAGGHSGSHSAAFHILHVDFSAAGEHLGTLVLGKDLQPVMSFFEAEFEVNLAIELEGTLIGADHGWRAHRILRQLPMSTGRNRFSL